MKRTFLGAVLVCLSFAGAASANDVSRRINVTEDFWEDSISWSSGIGGYQFLWTIINVDGKIEVCGVGTHTDMVRRRHEEDALRRSVILVNDRPVIQDLTYFASARSVRRLRSTPANCSATGVPYPRGRVGVQFSVDGKVVRF